MRVFSILVFLLALAGCGGGGGGGGGEYAEFRYPQAWNLYMPFLDDLLVPDGWTNDEVVAVVDAINAEMRRLFEGDYVELWGDGGKANLYLYLGGDVWLESTAPADTDQILYRCVMVTGDDPGIACLQVQGGEAISGDLGAIYQHYVADGLSYADLVHMIALAAYKAIALAYGLPDDGTGIMGDPATLALGERRAPTPAQSNAINTAILFGTDDESDFVFGQG